jgi:hypothetical protein
LIFRNPADDEESKMVYNVDNAPDWLNNIYQEVLNRKPDLTGMYYWIGVKDGGRSVEAIRESIYHSEEAVALRK